MRKSISIKEVSLHNKRSDSWVSCDGFVYDITEFIDRHPGGRFIIEPHLGTDISDVMRSPTYHDHSQNAFDLLQKYRIGCLEDYDISSQQLQRASTVDSKPKCKIDWSKGMLNQVLHMGECYEDWVYKPEPGSVRLFTSDFLESFTRAHWMVVPMFWSPIAALLLTYFCWYLTLQGVSRKNLVIKAMFSVFLGIALWPALEYSIHRFVFHLPLKNSRPWRKGFHFLIHGLHHKAPLDKYRLVFPPAPALILGIILYIMGSLLVGPHMLSGVGCGLIIGYVTYDMIHYYLHHGTPHPNSYLGKMKSIHNKHHYTQLTSGYGISTDWWDIIFGTRTTPNDNE